MDISRNSDSVFSSAGREYHLLDCNLHLYTRIAQAGEAIFLVLRPARFASGFPRAENDCTT